MGVLNRFGGALRRAFGAGRDAESPAPAPLPAPPPAPAPAPPLPPRPASSPLSAEAWDGLQNVLAGLGTTRDKRSYGEYRLTASSTGMNRAELEAMFMTAWLADRVVVMPAEDMTREWIEMSWDDHDEGQEDDQAVARAATRFDLQGKTYEALKWARLYGGAGIVIGIKGEDLATPLDLETIKQGSLESLHVFDRWWLTPGGARDLDVKSRNWGLPLDYLITDTATRVHWTRVIRFNGRPLPKSLWLANNCWDGSELAHVIENIRDYDTVRAAMASMVFEANVDIFSADNLADALATANGSAQVTARFGMAAMMKSINKMLVLDKEHESWQQKTTSFAGVRDVFDKFILDVSGASAIPVTLLFGQAPAGLNATGDSDVRNYFGRIHSRQQSQLRAPLTLLYEVLIRDSLGYFPDNFQIKFKPLWQISAVEKATIEKTKADRDAVYLDQGVISEGLAARQLKSDNVYSTMEDDDVEAAEDMAAAALEAAEAQTAATQAAAKAAAKAPPLLTNGVPPAPGAAPPASKQPPAAQPKAA